MASPVIHQIVSSDHQRTLPQFPRELDLESVPRSSSLFRCTPCPAFVGRRATPNAPRQGANAWAPWNKWKGPTRVKRRWEGGRLCRERLWRKRQQRYGSQVGERRILRGGTLWRLSEGPIQKSGTQLDESLFVKRRVPSIRANRHRRTDTTGNH